jgi:hypothetical protein
VSITWGEILELRQAELAELTLQTGRLRRWSRVCAIAAVINGAGALHWLGVW